MQTILKSPSVWLKLVLVTFLFGSCTAGLASKNITSKVTQIDTAITEPQSQPITVTSQDGVVQLIVPNTWQNIWTEANQDQWSLLVGKRSTKTQIGVRSIAKADYPQITSEAHAKAASAATQTPFANAEMIEEGQATTVNGHRAVRYQAKGTISGQHLVILSLSVETPDYYHSILVVGPDLAFAQEQDELNRIIQSLQET
jgi:hypothetical protein